jgi:hypothetical protein
MILYQSYYYLFLPVNDIFTLALPKPLALPHAAAPVGLLPLDEVADFEDDFGEYPLEVFGLFPPQVEHPMINNLKS